MKLIPEALLAHLVYPTMKAASYTLPKRNVKDGGDC